MGRSIAPRGWRTVCHLGNTSAETYCRATRPSSNMSIHEQSDFKEEVIRCPIGTWEAHCHIATLSLSDVLGAEKRTWTEFRHLLKYYCIGVFTSIFSPLTYWNSNKIRTMQLNLSKHLSYKVQKVVVSRSKKGKWMTQCLSLISLSAARIGSQATSDSLCENGAQKWFQFQLCIFVIYDSFL